nr:hypothetical protein [Tanacetum cinerariifolium]
GRGMEDKSNIGKEDKSSENCSHRGSRTSMKNVARKVH